MKRLLIVAAVALIALTGSAFAQGTQGPGWGGFYVGGHGGYGWGDRDGCIAVDTTSPCDSGDEPFDYDQDGWLIGGQIGYNHMFNRVLVGLEADASFASISGEEDFLDEFPGNGEYTWLAAFKARVGFTIDKVLLYRDGRPCACRVRL